MTGAQHGPTQDTALQSIAPQRARSRGHRRRPGQPPGAAARSRCRACRGADCRLGPARLLQAPCPGHGLERHRRAAGLGADARCAGPATAPADHHPGADRRGRAPFAGEGAAALARHQGLRGRRPLGGARRRPDGRRRRRQGTPRQARHGAQPGHRRGHQGRRHHPDQPARGVGCEAGARDLCERPRIGCADGRRAAGERPGRAQGEEPARRPGAGDDALHRRPGARATRSSPSATPSASARRSALAWCRAWAASSAPPKASTR